MLILKRITVSARKPILIDFLSFQVTSNTRRRKPYDKANLLQAYEATQSGMLVYRASCVDFVPEFTFRDNTRCYVALDSTPGPSTLLSLE